MAPACGTRFASHNPTFVRRGAARSMREEQATRPRAWHTAIRLQACVAGRSMVRRWARKLDDLHHPSLHPSEHQMRRPGLPLRDAGWRGLAVRHGWPVRGWLAAVRSGSVARDECSPRVWLPQRHIGRLDIRRYIAVYWVVEQQSRRGHLRGAQRKTSCSVRVRCKAGPRSHSARSSHASFTES